MCKLYPLHDVCTSTRHSCLYDAKVILIAQIDLWRIEGGVMWRTRLDRIITLHLSVYRTVRNIR